MASIRQRLGNLFVGKEMEDLRTGVNTLEQAYLAGKYSITPQMLIERLSEGATDQMVDLITRLTRDYVGLIGYESDAETMRGYYVNECRNLWRADVVSQWAVWLWTNFGFGETVEILPEDKAAQPVWKAFWDNDENAPILGADGLHRLSENVLVEGEFWLVYYIDTTGTNPPIVRTICTEEITEIVTDPKDDATPLYYKREWASTDGETDCMYYPDWLAVRTPDKLGRANLPEGAKTAQTQQSNTMVVAQHVAHNRKVFNGKGKLRGWPMYSAGAAWARTHTQFREDRASVAAAIAMYVNKIKANAGSRAVDTIASNLQSALTSGTTETNPATAAGGSWVENQALDLQRLSQQTGASDAKIDGESLMQMASLGAGAYSHYFGSGDAYRLATATAMEPPTQRQWSRYQKFWGAQWRKMVRIVLWAAETYPAEKELFGTHNAQVSTDRLVELGLQEISDSMSVMLRDGLQPYLEAGIISIDVAVEILTAVWQMTLQALGISDVLEIVPPDEVEPDDDEEAPDMDGDDQDEEPQDDEPSNGKEPDEEPAEELATASSLVELMKGWDKRIEMVEGTLRENHIAEEVHVKCPLEGCEGELAYRYNDHPDALLVCATCERTFNVELE